MENSFGGYILNLYPNGQKETSPLHRRILHMAPRSLCGGEPTADMNGRQAPRADLRERNVRSAPAREWPQVSMIWLQ